MFGPRGVGVIRLLRTCDAGAETAPQRHGVACYFQTFPRQIYFLVLYMKYKTALCHTSKVFHVGRSGMIRFRVVLRGRA